MKTQEQYYEIYRDFKGMLMPKVNGSMNHIKQAINNIADLDKTNAITFMLFAYEYWYAYIMDIIEGNYNYIRFTGMVWSSYLEHMEK